MAEITQIINSPKETDVIDMNNYYTKSEVDNLIPDVSDKVDNVDGKGLSTNDYSDEDKKKVLQVTELQTAVGDRVVKVAGKGLSTNDYTTPEKQKLAGLSNYDDTQLQKKVQQLATDLSRKSNKDETPDFVTITAEANKSIEVIKNEANNSINSIITGVESGYNTKINQIITDSNSKINTAISGCNTATNSANSAATKATTAANTIDDKIATKANQSDLVQLGSEVNSINQALGLNNWYGVCKLASQASPDKTRIGYMENHKNLPVHNLIRPCIVNRDCKVVYWLDRNDITKKLDGTPAKLDGTDGQVCVYYPDHYAIIQASGSDGLKEINAVGLTPFEYDGVVAEFIPAFVHSMDNVTIKRSTGELYCCYNEDTDFAGSGSKATSGGLGYARTSTSNYAYCAAAKKYGTGFVNSFYKHEQVITNLMVIEYATNYLKKPFNAILTDEGYKQGGLGDGPVEWNGTKWSNYNGYNPIVKILEPHLALCNKSNNGTGIYIKTVVADEAKTYNTPFPVWRWQGMLWGHLWNWACGVSIDVKPNTDEDPTNKLYVAENIEDVLSTNDNDFSFTTQYTYMGELGRQSGYMKDAINGLWISKTQEAGSNTYLCTYYLASIPASRERRGFHLGGALDGGGYAARSAANSNSRPSYSAAYIGSGLSANVIK